MFFKTIDPFLIVNYSWIEYFAKNIQSMKSFKHICLAATLLLLGTQGCQIVIPDKGEALFDSFEYIGNDDIYVNNPLPSEDCLYNPILAGWYSDPSICTNGEGDYFLTTSTFSYVPGIPLFHSRDLVNWKQIGNVLTRESQLKNLPSQKVSGGIFAPDIKYNPVNKTYYMITVNVGAGNFYVKTTDPWSGEWSEPVLLPEVGGIDPSFFFDDNGKAYIVNNDDAPDYKPEYEGHRTIRIREFDLESEKVCSEEKIIVNKGVHPEDKPIWIEGPHMYKINGSYILMCAEGGTEYNHSEVVFKSDSPWGPFVPYKGNPILTQRHLDPSRPNPVTCAGHADIIQTNDGKWWAVFLGTRPIDGEFENLGRETFLVPVNWTEDGFPVMLEGDQTVPQIVKVEGSKRGNELTFGNFSKKDDFNAKELGLQWMTLRGDAKDLYSLDKVPGYLSLKYSENTLADLGTPSAIFTRMHHHKFSVKTTVLAGEGGKAGLAIMKDEENHYTLTVSDGCVCVSYKDNILASEPLKKSGKVTLMIESSGKEFSFSYSSNGKDFSTILSGADAKCLSTAAAEGFTGTTIGLYATCR